MEGCRVTCCNVVGSRTHAVLRPLVTSCPLATILRFVYCRGPFVTKVGPQLSLVTGMHLQSPLKPKVLVPEPERLMVTFGKGAREVMRKGEVLVDSKIRVALVLTFWFTGSELIKTEPLAFVPLMCSVPPVRVNMFPS